MMEEIKKRLEEVTNRLYGVKPDVEVTEAPESTGADYASNLAMQLAKLVHKAPIVIAEEIKAELAEQDFETEVAKPGFLNFKVGMLVLRRKIERMADEVGIKDKTYDGRTVVCEFSDPNPFKVLHVGHLYTSVVGDSISRILELAGAKVVRANFGGDVGLHVAKTIFALEKQLSSSGLRDFLDNLNIEDIAKCYVEGTRAYEEDEEAHKRITELNKEIYRINQENVREGEIAEIYWRGRELSYQYFKDFYARIGVEFDRYYPESSVASRGLREVRIGLDRGVYEESDGAVIYRGEKVGLHTRVFINREGVPTYEAKDVGLIFTKWDDWHFDESVVITGNEQTEYMKVVLASVSEYAPKLVERTSHLTHGLVKLPGSVKMSSRKGNFLKAVDVLEMIKAELGEDADERILLAAIKYAFLKYRVGGDIVFDPKESVAMNGNSGVYLLYSVVRAKKVLNKVEKNDAMEHQKPDREKLGDDLIVAQTDENVKSEEEVERRLMMKLAQYEDTLGVVIAEKLPSKLCTYLYELAQEFSRFYEKVRVAGNEREEELVKIVQAYIKVMEQGLELLGIEVPEEM